VNELAPDLAPSLVQYRAAESLERWLGDPLAADGAFTLRQAVANDESGEFPQAACDRLAEWGFPAYQVPRAMGGQLDSHEELVALLRVVARRDVAVALGYGMVTYMAGINVWVAGSEAQKRDLSGLVLAGHPLVVAYHERGNGSDVLASEVTAVPIPGGYRLCGEKWIVNNVGRGAAITLFARTDPAGGPRGFSLFLLRRSDLDTESFSPLPRVKPMGVRSCEIGGLRFADCRVPEEARIGALGSGFESTLKSFQVTRTMIPALSLGAADTALRATLDFALSRRLYGDTVFAIPHARTVLVNAFVDLLLCDCVLISAARGLHSSTAQQSVTSAVAKVFVASRAERAVRDLAVILGARYYLREGHWFGVFQKIVRDLPVVSVGHAGTHVCLYSLGLQLRQLLRTGRPAALPEDAEARSRRLATTFSLTAPLPPFEPERLELVSRGRNDVLDGLGPDLLPTGELDPRVAADLASSLAALTGELAELRAAHDGLDPRTAAKSAEMFDLAERYCTLHGAAACLHFWSANRGVLGGFFARGEWLAAGLARLLEDEGAERTERLAPYVEPIAQELLALHEAGRLFSLVPLKLGAAA
jgi:alkylation response protein AidB-like acyl-CoA dehydrogenase